MALEKPLNLVESLFHHLLKKDFIYMIFSSSKILDGMFKMTLTENQLNTFHPNLNCDLVTVRNEFEKVLFTKGTIYNGAVLIL